MCVSIIGDNERSFVSDVVASDVCGEDAGRFYLRTGVSSEPARALSLSPAVPRLCTAL